MKHQLQTIRHHLEPLANNSGVRKALTALSELEAMVGEQEPCGWFESPYGAFRGNPLLNITFPASTLTWQIPAFIATPPAQQPQARPDFNDEWTGYLKDGETPFERFLRERKDLGALTKLYQRALEENERLKARQQQAEVGNSGFDHKTASDFLSGKTVSDEAVRKFVQASRWAHDDRASLQSMLLSVRNELASREAEIALLKKELMDAEAAPQQAEAVPSDVVRVSVEILNDWKSRVNTLATLSTKAERYAFGIKLKQDIADAAQGEKP